MSLIAGLLEGILGILPSSPFQSMIVAIEDSQILSFLNWFIPFGTAVSMLEAWAVCMLAYYIYKYGKGGINRIIGKLVS